MHKNQKVYILCSYVASYTAFHVDTSVHVLPEALYSLIVSAGASYHATSLSSFSVNHMSCDQNILQTLVRLYLR